MKKRIFAALFATLLTATVLPACTTSNDEPTDDNQSTSENTSTDSETEESEADGGESERMKLTILQPMASGYPADVDTNDNSVTQTLDEELPHIDIEWIMVPGNAFGERKTMLMNSGDLPDVVPASSSEMITWADKGLIQPITDIHDEYYPNIRNFLNEEDLVQGKYNGEQYGILSPVNPIENPQMGYIRQDWLDNLNLEAPTNTDELYEVLRAFTYDDPDGNGVDDTVGVAGQKGTGNIQFIPASFGVHFGQWSTVDGEIIPDIIRPEMRDALEFLGKLYSDGIMDQDSLVNEWTQLKEKFIRGETGYISTGSWDMNSSMITDLQKTVSTAKVSTLEPITAPDGEKYIAIGGRVAGNGSGIRVVSTTCEYPEAALEYANWIIGIDESVSPIFSLNSDKFYFGPNKECLVPIGDKFYSEIGIGELPADVQVLRELTTSYRWHWGSWQNLDNEGMVELANVQVEEGLMQELSPIDKEMAGQ